MRKMLLSFLKAHSVPFTDGEGRLAFRPGTCSEFDSLCNDPHVRFEIVSDGRGGEIETETLVDCRTAENERQHLLSDTTATSAEVGRLNDVITGLETKLANAERLMAGAFQIIFHMGPALTALISDDMGYPKLTDDKSAVKLEGVLYTVVIDIFNPNGERIYLRPISGQVPERTFRLSNGRLSTDDQTLFIGHVGRIKTADTTGRDPVDGTINLVADAASV
jgi:hypothetical protein